MLSLNASDDGRGLEQALGHLRADKDLAPLLACDVKVGTVDAQLGVRDDRTHQCALCEPVARLVADGLGSKGIDEAVHSAVGGGDAAGSGAGLDPPRWLVTILTALRRNSRK